MLPKKEATTCEKCGKAPTTMTKGLTALKSIADRNAKAPDWKLQSNQPSISKLSQVICGYYQKTTEGKDVPSPRNSGLAPQMEKLQKAFLRRPGCPRVSTRATSMSHFGLTVAAALPKELDVNKETWRMTEDTLSSQQCSDTNVNEHLLAFSKSACEFNYLRSSSKSQTASPVSGSPVTAQSHQRKKMPWYISVIHEKDNCLLLLCKEVQRLSELETKSQKKDQETQMLREEMETLKKQLTRLLKSKGWEMSVSPGLRADTGSPRLPTEQVLSPSPEDRSRQPISLELLREQVEALRVQIGSMQELLPDAPTESGQGQEDSMVAGKGKDLEEGGEDSEEEVDLEGTAQQAEGTVAKESAGKKGALEEEVYKEEEGGEEEEEEEVESQRVVEEESDEEDEEEIRRRSCFLDEAFEDELIARLEEYEQAVQEIQDELEITRTRYLLATGAITSLQRQVDFQESQLQKINTENEMLQKELCERKNQLQAMSNKFSNLREDRKHEEMMGLIENDNLLLRQQVLDLESELRKREHTISEYDAKVHQLQTQVNLNQNHLERWKQLQEELQSKNELMQQAEQQCRVALESTQARLERLRNKIIQATFSIPGVKSMVTEITDNDILEALQRVISERTEYYNQLKQKGVKMPQMSQPDVILSSPSKFKKLTTK